MEQPKLNPSKSTGLKMSKKKRKFRAMTCKEFCSKHESCENCPEYNTICCSGFMCAIDDTASYQPTKGKYIFIEVKE